MKSNQPPDLNKVLNRRATAREIRESYERSRRAVGRKWSDRHKPETPT